MVSYTQGRKPANDLFESARAERIDANAPLAARMRPRTLDEFIGQEAIVGPGRLLRRAIPGGPAEQPDLLWSARHRQDDPGPGDRQHHRRPFHRA